MYVNVRVRGFEKNRSAYGGQASDLSRVYLSDSFRGNTEGS